MMNNTERFIPVFNVMFDSREGSDRYRVNAEELLMYYALYQYKSQVRDETKICFVGLLGDLKKRNKKENREKSKRVIERLQESEAIRIHEMTKDYFVISFNSMDKFQEVESKNSKYIKGFEKMYVEELDFLFEQTGYNANMIYLYSLLKSKQSGGRPWVNMSYAVLAKGVQASESTVRRAIATLKELELIHVKTLTKTDQHEANRYRVNNIMNSIWAKREEELEREQEEERRELERLERQSIEDLKGGGYEGGNDYYSPF